MAKQSFLKEDIGVIGLGVIGLSTAIMAQEAGYRVTIYSDCPISSTTSAKAAANFKPHEVAYNDLAHEMLERGWKVFEKYAERYPKESGVRKHLHWEASSAPKEQPRYLKVFETPEVCEFPDIPGGYNFGWRYVTFFIDISVYLPWLQKRFIDAGGKIQIRKVSTLEELDSFPTQVIFNCTGLGSLDLCRDQSMVPVKGQIVTINPQPDMRWSISGDGFYVYPRRHDTVLGGTTEWNINNENVDNGAINLIIQGNKRILPTIGLNSLKDAYAGIRPYRENSIRIEVQELNRTRIIHNYGHGGSGITLSWGSAQIALSRMLK